MRSILTATLVFAVSLPAPAWQRLDRDIDIECIQGTNRTSINCDYRLTGANNVSDISADLAGTTLQLTTNQTWPYQDSKTAILFLVDTSDPGRQAVIQKNAGHIEKLLQSLDQQKHQIGLAKFDKELSVLAPIGSASSEIIAAAKNLNAVGKTTELYRNLLDAIDIISAVNADRKVIFLLSDGQAEDQAYFHSDVIARARNQRVVINGIGYARSVPLSVALQTVRRLSEETGGRYIEANSAYELPDSIYRSPLDRIENGGRFSIDLKNIDYSAIPENAPIRLNLVTERNSISLKLPVQIPLSKPEPVKSTAPVDTVAADDKSTPGSTKSVQATPAQPVQVAPVAPVIVRESVTSTLDKWFLYGIPIALVVLLLLTVASLLVGFMRSRERSVPQVQIGDIKPYAYLVLQDETKRRYPITRTTWRIGRSKDNELSLDDNSISRRHAEIHRSQGDDFTIIDLDSLNGVFVNNEKVKIQSLKEGDIVEVGDVNFRFSLHSAEYPLEESTVMQKTKTPAYTH